MLYHMSLLFLQLGSQVGSVASDAGEKDLQDLNQEAAFGPVPGTSTGSATYQDKGIGRGKSTTKTTEMSEESDICAIERVSVNDSSYLSDISENYIYNHHRRIQDFVRGGKALLPPWIRA